jgi:hypothetical protein
VDPEQLKPLYDALHRYAGWLDRDRTSVMVRADVQALGTAIDTCADPTPLLQALDTDLARLPSGELRKILRAASAKIRLALAESR